MTGSIRSDWMAAIALAAVGFLVAAGPAQAIGVGRVTVQSALGEPLRAVIELRDPSPDELASLQSNVAPADAFRASGMALNPALVGVRIKLAQRPDGRYVLELEGDRPVTDPFVDLLLEASWSSGHVLRDYTMMFQPGAQPAKPALAARPSPAVARSAAPKPSSSTSTLGAGPVKRVTVRRGDTAGRIAAAHKPRGVPLRRVLQALLHDNPEAFVDNDINRLKVGAVLQFPARPA